MISKRTAIRLTATIELNRNVEIAYFGNRTFILPFRHVSLYCANKHFNLGRCFKILRDFLYILVLLMQRSVKTYLRCRYITFFIISRSLETAKDPTD